MRGTSCAQRRGWRKRPGTETHLHHTNQRQTATPCGQHCAIAGATLTLLYFTTHTGQLANCASKMLIYLS